jgi:hypothetical protein
LPRRHPQPAPLDALPEIGTMAALDSSEIIKNNGNYRSHQETLAILIFRVNENSQSGANYLGTSEFTSHSNKFPKNFQHFRKSFFISDF